MTHEPHQPISKIFEPIIRDNLDTYLEDNGLIRDSQHEFRKGRLFLTDMLIFLDRASRVINLGNEVHVIFPDFMKAFDKYHMRG